MKDGLRTSATIKSALKPEKQQEKSVLSPIEEETDSFDSSGDGASNYDNIENDLCTRRNYQCDIDRSALSDEYDEHALVDLEGASRDDEGRSPPFLTPRNTSDHVSKYDNCDTSSATSMTSNEGSTEDDEEIAARENFSFLDGSTSDDIEDSYRVEDRQDNDPAIDVFENDDLQTDITEHVETSDEKTNRRPKSAPLRSIPQLEPSEASTRRDDKFTSDISVTLDSLETRIVRSERDIFNLRKELTAEKIRGRKLAKRYDEDKKIARESLRIDLELWIKKLNDGLKGYLADWQKHERLRLNEEISKISDIYSQEIAKSLRVSLKEWQTEDAKNILKVIERLERSRVEKEKANAKVSYEKIQVHLENLEMRNAKSYSALCKQIDKWEDRLRGEIVKLHEDGLKKLQQQISSWYGDGRKNNVDSRVNCEKNNGGLKRSNSFLGAEALTQMEENLLKRLRESSSKDLRRMEQIIRAELRVQRREFAKRINDKIGEFRLAFEEFGGCSSNAFDRVRSRVRNDLDEFRGGATSLDGHRDMGHRSIDGSSRPEVFGVGRIGRKIVRSTQPGGSSLSTSNFDEDADRDYGEDEDDGSDTAGESIERHRWNTILTSPVPDLGINGNLNRPDK